MDAALSLSSLDEFAQGHRLLLREILTPDQRSDIARFRAIYRTKQGSRPELILFHELQILNATKLALEYCDDEAESPANSWRPLVEALLILNDHLIPAGIWRGDYNDLGKDEQTEGFIRYMVPNMVFHRGSRLLNLISRWYDLFFVDAPYLSRRPDYIDLPAELGKVISLDSKLFYRIGSAFFTHWMKPTISYWNPVLNLTTWFRDFDIEPREYEPVLGQLALTRDQLKEQFRERGGWEPYFFLPIQAKPFLRINDVLLCLSRRFAAEKIASGLYHLLLTKLPTSGERDRFLTFFGFVFESYVNRLLERAFPSTSLATRYFPNVKDPKTGNEITDAILDYGDALVLIEAKSTLFSLPGLVSGDPQVLRQKFQDIVYDAAEQLDKAVKAVNTGALSTLGITPDRIKFYYPLVVTLQFFPLEPITYRRLEETIAARGLLRGPGIAPLQMAYIEDLERMETAMATGRAVADLLRVKVTDKRLKVLSFGNFLLEHVPQIVNRHNHYLEERFAAIRDELLAFFKSRQKTMR